MRKCSRCGNDTNLGALCQKCRNYFNKQYRLRKIKKYKLFLIKKDEEIKLVFTDDKNEVKEFLKDVKDERQLYNGKYNLFKKGE